MPRRTWLDHKVDVLVEELAASGMHLDRRHAGELISDRVRAVAALMRVTEPTARKYLGDETVRDMARRMLFEFAGEQPGADLMEVPRTVPLARVFAASSAADDGSIPVGRDSLTAILRLAELGLVHADDAVMANAHEAMEEIRSALGDTAPNPSRGEK